MVFCSGSREFFWVDSDLILWTGGGSFFDEGELFFEVGSPLLVGYKAFMAEPLTGWP